MFSICHWDSLYGELFPSRCLILFQEPIEDSNDDDKDAKIAFQIDFQEKRIFLLLYFQLDLEKD